MSRCTLATPDTGSDIVHWDSIITIFLLLGTIPLLLSAIPLSNCYLVWEVIRYILVMNGNDRMQSQVKGRDGRQEMFRRRVMTQSLVPVGFSMYGKQSSLRMRLHVSRVGVLL